MESEIMIFFPIFCWLGLGLFILIVASCLGPSKARSYRKDLSDMYVVGKIKQLADKEGISIQKEFAEFAKVTKNKRIDFESIDLTIEREMQEKIATKAEVKQEKIAANPKVTPTE